VRRHEALALRRTRALHSASPGTLLGQSATLIDGARALKGPRPTVALRSCDVAAPQEPMLRTPFPGSVTPYASLLRRWSANASLYHLRRWAVHLIIACLAVYSTLRLMAPDRGNLADWLDALAASRDSPSAAFWDTPSAPFRAKAATAEPASAPTAQLGRISALESLATLSTTSWAWTSKAQNLTPPRIFVYPGWLYSQLWGGSASQYVPAYAALAANAAQQYALHYPYRTVDPDAADILVTLLASASPSVASRGPIEAARALCRALAANRGSESCCRRCRHVILAGETALIVSSTEMLFDTSVPSLEVRWLVPPFPNAFDAPSSRQKTTESRPYTVSVLTQLLPSESLYVASWYAETDVRFFTSSDALDLWSLASSTRFCLVSASPHWQGRIAVAMSAGCIPLCIAGDSARLVLGESETVLPGSPDQWLAVLRLYPTERVEQLSAGVQAWFQSHLGAPGAHALDDATPAYAQQLAIRFFVSLAEERASDEELLAPDDAKYTPDIGTALSETLDRELHEQQ